MCVTNGSSPQFSFREFSYCPQFDSNSVINSVLSISFKTEIQPLSTKTILHEISAAGTQTKMASLTFKRWMHVFFLLSTSVISQNAVL